ncbi:NADH-quinone oxidoreductase subunit K [Polyangium sp. y55x31]|uniref:sodium:proton antiporter n=1 Tax=Polyangium sp. y55x31 TaxID=3042688 RepID=UPI0024828D34|nr:NADH-quinone oxidoreductase subunit K [Polyangium sp. y55x31]MDI1483620.1 NADH-quinone oxidoreductase subunit K [Polyangium sp. y55x31]
MIALAAILAGILVACGLYLMLSRNLQRMVIGFLLLSNGVNLLVLTAAGLPARAAPPLLGEGASGSPFADPLAQAFILTAIVIGLGMAAFLVALSTRLHEASGRDDVEGDDET